jgi:hypothetical protein
LRESPRQAIESLVLHGTLLLRRGHDENTGSASIAIKRRSHASRSASTEERDVQYVGNNGPIARRAL